MSQSPRDQVPRDQAYDRAQSRLTRDAAHRYQQPDWGRENPRTRQAYDRELSQSMPVIGRRGRR
ncbi:hypothetical protein AB0392_06065 [Nonomuraea angiospora]|uniref:hypothetical protein n=1 Tax=Nonomuraea angiospora TaxID=46172 RepID=UPI00344D7A2E